MSKHEQQFRDTLSEILEMDKADLDFGIYRIMNAKREEISTFLDKELIPQVRRALGGEGPELAQKEDEVFFASLSILQALLRCRRFYLKTPLQRRGLCDTL